MQLTDDRQSNRNRQKHNRVAFCLKSLIVLQIWYLNARKIILSFLSADKIKVILCWQRQSVVSEFYCQHKSWSWFMVVELPSSKNIHIIFSRWLFSGCNTHKCNDYFHFRQHLRLPFESVQTASYEQRNTTVQFHKTDEQLPFWQHMYMTRHLQHFNS